MPSSSSSKKQQIISRSEFSKHSVSGDCWIEIEGKVYDVSSWMLKHPGGERLLECLGGKDASLPFLLNHDPWVGKKYLASMYVGNLAPKEKPGKYDALTQDFKTLYHELMDKGWFDTSYTYYAKKVVILMAMLCGVVYLLQLSQHYGLEILAFLAAVLLGIFKQQIAFFGHDIGHNAVTHNNTTDTIIGLFCGNLFQGISMGWWKYTHNVHHVRTNDEEWDPDIQHMPVVAITTKYLEAFWSKFHRQHLPPTESITWCISRVFVAYQQYHWFVSLMSSRLFLYISSLIFTMWQQPKGRNGRHLPFRGYMFLEAAFLVLYHVWTISLFAIYTNYPKSYYFVSYLVAGILHIQIIMNHFPCPLFEDIDDNFVVHQLQSSMAIASNKYTHWFYGGLQFQVEHHLFPTMPRHNLRRVQPYIRELCKKYQLPYLENTFWGACRDIHGILADVGKHSAMLNDIRYGQHSD